MDSAPNLSERLDSLSLATMTTPLVLAAAGRRGQGATEWLGWLKVSPTMLFEVFELTIYSRGLKNFSKGPDELVKF
jgi:hypothetical protein